MMVNRRSTVSLVPTCRPIETRLAPSGNFLSHGFADISRDIKHLEHHHPAEHSTMTTAETAKELTVHYHHIVAETSK